MRITENCVQCLYEKQRALTDDESYLARVRAMLEGRAEEETAPWMVYRFSRLYEEFFGKPVPYRQIRQQFNDLVLSMEDGLRARIETAEDPLAAAMLYARVGNYIDFGALNRVDEAEFLALFDSAALSEHDSAVIAEFRKQCAEAERFLLIADNCGEIVLDRLFLEQMHREFPALKLSVMVRGGEVLNDAVAEDAHYAGIDALAEIVTNGLAAAGTFVDRLPAEARCVFDSANVILAKGQGNYESLAGQGYHIFYAFLCKCDLFTRRFGVPKLTGMFAEERG